MGFKGDIKKAGARSYNLWIFRDLNQKEMYWDFENEPQPSCIYISFPSLKDPSHIPGE